MTETGIDRPSARRSVEPVVWAVIASLVGAGILAIAASASVWSILPASGIARWYPGATTSTVPPAGSDRSTARPSRIRIPAIRVDSPLGTVGLDAHRVLEAPTDFMRAAWYAGGTAPGDIGPAIIVGHYDSRTGPAVFFDLAKLHDGDVVEVARGEQWVRFSVVAVRRYPKDKFPTAEVHGPTPGPELRLITCGGDFDRRSSHYVDNIVVYAVIL